MSSCPTLPGPLATPRGRRNEPSNVAIIQQLFHEVFVWRSVGARILLGKPTLLRSTPGLIQNDVFGLLVLVHNRIDPRFLSSHALDESVQMLAKLLLLSRLGAKAHEQDDLRFIRCNIHLAYSCDAETISFAVALTTCENRQCNKYSSRQ